MSRSKALHHIRSQLFSSAVLVAVLGFGVFFDHLADRLERKAERVGAPAFDRLVTALLPGTTLVSFQPEALAPALPAQRVPREFADEALHPDCAAGKAAKSSSL